jgi:hypothetical protein
MSKAKLKTMDDLKQRYVAAVSTLPHVRKVVFYPNDGQPIFWTLIDSPHLVHKGESFGSCPTRRAACLVTLQALSCHSERSAAESRNLRPSSMLLVTP